MNERKSFQSITQKEKIKSKNGITLIALVISIIVMLILAGVSLNATIGDNGIITQAQNATYMQSISALEEYLQTEYVKYYDETENYTSKIELLSSKLGNLCLKDGTKNYITYDGKMYYLINKQALPDDVKNQLRGGDTTEYLKYIRLQDVYGVTPDLKVYYCESGTDSALGTLDSTELDPSTPLKKINQDAEMKSAITEALASVGVTVGENGVTVGDASKLKNIELDGSKHNITSISGLSELSSLKTVTLSNLNLNDLDGLQNCTLLYYVYFKNCKVNDYSKLATVLDLQYLYLYLPPSMSEADANAQVTNLGNGLANATEMNKLEYFGISGTTAMMDGNYSLDVGLSNNKWGYGNSNLSKVTSIKSLENFSDNIKKTIKYVYLNNNSFFSIECFSGFTNIYELDLMCNKSLVNLNGLENHKNLVYLFAHSCNLNSISGLKGSEKLYKLDLYNNLQLQSLEGLEESKNIDHINADNCDIRDINALNNNTSLRFLQLNNNVNLQSIIALKNCTGIRKLYLGKNENMLGTEVRDALADPDTHILQNCGGYYTIPSKYNLYFSTLTSYDYSNLDLIDSSDEINSLKNKTNVTRLNLSGNANLSDAKLQEILSTMTNVQYLSLNGCENLKSIDFINKGKMTKLIELDLRGTGVENLTNLNEYGNNLLSLIIDNNNINLKEIEGTIKRICNKNNWNNLQDSWIGPNGFDCRGFITCNDYDYSVLTGLTHYMIGASKIANCNYTINLENCKNLTSVYLRGGRKTRFKFPESLKTFETLSGGFGFCDFSLCTNLMSITIDEVASNNVDNSLATLPTNNKISYLCLGRYYSYTIDALARFNCINLKYFKINSYAPYGSTKTITSFKNIKNASNLEEIIIYDMKNLSDISEIKYCTKVKNIIIDQSDLANIENLKYCTNLENIEISRTSVGNILSLENLNNITSLNLSNNNIASIESLKNKKNIQSLNLAGNNISNLSTLETLIENGKIKFTELDISNNLLQANTVDGNNNVETLKKLYNAGLRNLNISKNNFPTGSTDELKSLKWNYYKE